MIEHLCYQFQFYLCVQTHFKYAEAVWLVVEGPGIDSPSNANVAQGVVMQNVEVYVGHSTIAQSEGLKCNISLV